DVSRNEKRGPGQAQVEVHVPEEAAVARIALGRKTADRRPATGLQRVEGRPPADERGVEEGMLAPDSLPPGPQREREAACPGSGEENAALGRELAVGPRDVGDLRIEGGARRREDTAPRQRELARAVETQARREPELREVSLPVEGLTVQDRI